MPGAISGLRLGDKSATAPRFLSGEVGLIDEFTVVVKFNRPVLASDYATGVKIWTNGVEKVVDSAARQVSTDTVHYVLHTAVIGSDYVTMEYGSGGVGDYSNWQGTKDVASFSGGYIVNHIGQGQPVGMLLSITYAG